MNNLETNVAIFCASAKQAIKMQGKPLMDRIQLMANDMHEQNQHTIPYNTFIKMIVNWTKECITNEGWSLTDVDGISWFIALFAKAYSIIKPEYNFDRIFKDAFKLYYQETPF